MPYGMPKGMETPEMDAKMERCVADVMKTGKSKESAIRICKSTMIKAHKLREMSKNKS